MGIEILDADLAQGQLKDRIQRDVDHVKQNQGSAPEEPIKFGLVDSAKDTINGPPKGEAYSVANGNFPKDAVDEWPAPKQIHTFYFVRYRSYEDPKLKAKIDQADKEIQKANQVRFQITEALKAKRSERASIISQLKALSTEDKQYRLIVDEKMKEMEPFRAALGKLRTANNTAREKGVGLCSSEEELNELIQSIHYRVQHESNTLVEEKQLLRDIKQLEGTREKVIANAAMKAKIEDSLGQKEAIQDQVKLIGGDLDGVRKEQSAVRTKIKQLKDELQAIDNDISSLQQELTELKEKRDKAYEIFSELRKKRDEGNAYYYQNRSLLNNAKDLVAKKDIEALQELSHTEVENFMSSWASTKAFRDDYERRILPSLDARQLSRDGRMRNPDEKPIVQEVRASAEIEKAPVKANIKRTKEDVKPPQEDHTVSTNNVAVHKEGSDKLPEAETKKKNAGSETKGKVANSEETEGHSAPEKLPREFPAADTVDAAKLKENKREEEIAKAKLALERKKRLAEKVAARAAIRAQKEAEKKLREREKKAKKKAGSSTLAADAEQTETDPETVVESEKTEENIETPVVVAPKSKGQKQNVRHRIRAKGPGPPPRTILKREKFPSYWAYAALGAAVLVLLLLILAYYYLL